MRWGAASHGRVHSCTKLLLKASISDTDRQHGKETNALASPADEVSKHRLRKLRRPILPERWRKPGTGPPRLSNPLGAALWRDSRQPRWGQ